VRILALALLLGLTSPALADRTVAQYVTACGLTGTAGSIVADVYNASAAGSLVATLPNGSFTRVAGTSDCYTTNLAAAAGISYPTASDATEKHYLLKFRDDSANEVWASATVAGVAGATGEVPERCKKRTLFYANSPIPSRGITQGLINEGAPSYAKVDVACDGDFGTPDATYFEHFFYDSTRRAYLTQAAAAVPNP
jgi:hypothetical protein